MLLLGDYGLPQPFYFPFTKTYWCGKQKSKANISTKSHEAELCKQW